jgi:hypothetical protein
MYVKIKLKRKKMTIVYVDSDNFFLLLDFCPTIAIFVEDCLGNP